MFINQSAIQPWDYMRDTRGAYELKRSWWHGCCE